MLTFSLVLTASAQGVTYMPGVTTEMFGADYWTALYDDAQEVILDAGGDRSLQYGHLSCLRDHGHGPANGQREL